MVYIRAMGSPEGFDWPSRCWLLTCRSLTLPSCCTPCLNIAAQRTSGSLLHMARVKFYFAKRLVFVQRTTVPQHRDTSLAASGRPNIGRIKLAGTVVSRILPGKLIGPALLLVVHRYQPAGATPPLPCLASICHDRWDASGTAQTPVWQVKQPNIACRMSASYHPHVSILRCSPHLPLRAMWPGCYFEDIGTAGASCRRPAAICGSFTRPRQLHPSSFGWQRAAAHPIGSMYNV